MSRNSFNPAELCQMAEDVINRKETLGYSHWEIDEEGHAVGQQILAILLLLINSDMDDYDTAILTLDNASRNPITYWERIASTPLPQRIRQLERDMFLGKDAQMSLVIAQNMSHFRNLPLAVVTFSQDHPQPNPTEVSTAQTLDLFNPSIVPASTIWAALQYQANAISLPRLRGRNN